MKKLLLLLLALGFVSLQAQSKWEVDPGHSNIGFGITHMMISTTEGQFNKFSIDLQSNGSEDFSNATVSATIDASTIDTDNEKRDNHLKTEDFFDVEKYPEITFTSSSFTKEKGNTYRITGKMTMHGITKEVTFDTKLIGVGEDPYGNTRSGWKATTTIDRTEFGMEGSTAMVGTEVEIELNLEMILQKG